MRSLRRLTVLNVDQISILSSLFNIIIVCLLLERGGFGERGGFVVSVKMCAGFALSKLN